MSARALVRRLIHDNARNLYEENMREAIRDVENKKLASLAHDTKTTHYDSSRAQILNS